MQCKPSSSIGTSVDAGLGAVDAGLGADVDAGLGADGCWSGSCCR